MTSLQLPEKVVASWGSEAAEDFVEWLDTRLRDAPSKPKVQITPLAARQQVNVLMLEKVGNLLLAGEPWLVQTAAGSRWRVPVDLTYPGRGRVGQVGTLDVDASLGLVIYTEESLQLFRDEAEALAVRAQLATN